MGLFSKKIKVENQEIALERGTLKELKMVQAEVTKTFEKNEQDLFKEKKAIALIREAEKEIIKLEKDSEIVDRLLQLQSQIKKQEAGHPWRRGVAQLRKEEEALRKKMNYELADGQRVLNKVLATIQYIHTLTEEVRRRKELEFKEDTHIEAWCRDASNRTRKVLAYMQQFVAGIPRTTRY